MSKETQSTAIEGYIRSTGSEIQQKTEALENIPSDEQFLAECEIGLLIEEQEMWKKYPF